MKSLYLAATVSSGECGADEKHRSFLLKVDHSDNMLAVFQRIKNLSGAQFCSSKREAETLVALWNASYVSNGTFSYYI